MLLEWSMQVKLSLTASDFNSLYGDVMQALPDSSRYLSILVDGFRVQSRGDHGWPPLACGTFSTSSDIEGCREVVSGVIWIRLLDAARLMQVYPGI